MSNRRKARRPDLSDGDPGASLPKVEKVLVKTVPAVIHWSKFKDIERNDDEVVGETLIYEDGDTDIIINSGGLSPEADKLMNKYAALKSFSIQREAN